MSRTPAEIRRMILQELYETYKKTPHQFVKASDLVADLGIYWEDGQWNISYLAEKNYIEARKTLAGWSELKVKISPPGVDIIEDPSEFNKQFPDINLEVKINVENFLLNVRQAIEASDKSDEEKREILAEVKEFLSNPVISPFVGHGLLKLFGL